MKRKTLTDKGVEPFLKRKQISFEDNKVSEKNIDNCKLQKCVNGSLISFLKSHFHNTNKQVLIIERNFELFLLKYNLNEICEHISQISSQIEFFNVICKCSLLLINIELRKCKKIKS